MFNRKKLRRERLEIYLVYLLLAYRRLLLVGGIALLVYAVLVMIKSPLAGTIVGVVATYPLLLATSYRAVLLTARFGAWIGTLGRK
jgi:hypothetical protein